MQNCGITLQTPRCQGVISEHKKLLTMSTLHGSEIDPEEFTCVHTASLHVVYKLNQHSCKPKIFQIKQRSLVTKNIRLYCFKTLRCLVCKPYKNTFVFKRRQALRFQISDQGLFLHRPSPQGEVCLKRLRSDISLYIPSKRG